MKNYAIALGFKGKLYNDFSKNHYDKIVANVNNTRVRDQEE